MFHFPTCKLINKQTISKCTLKSAVLKMKNYVNKVLIDQKSRLTYMFRDMLSQNSCKFGQWIQDQGRLFATHNLVTDKLLAHAVLHIICGNKKHTNK